jgi:hypothetical protein
MSNRFHGRYNKRKRIQIYIYIYIHTCMNLKGPSLCPILVTLFVAQKSQHAICP